VKQANIAAKPQTEQRLSKWLSRIAASIGLRPGQLTTWAMRTVLGFLVISFPAHQLALHFYYSSKGTLLSGGLAACFGGLLAWSLSSKHGKHQDALILLSPFALITSLYLVMPTQLNLLYSLVVTSVFLAFVLQTPPNKSLLGGRTELISKLQPIAFSQMGFALRQTFFLWALFALGSQVIYSATLSHSAAFVPLLAIAVSCTAVQTSRVTKESR
jgi:hypothetical protein